jgi:hypothetical protein
MYKYLTICLFLDKLQELGRADDLWSLFYLLVEFTKGSLPWKGKEKDTIGSLKQVHTSSDLLDDLPKPMVLFHDHLASLRYADRPDYDLLESLMKSLIALPSGLLQQQQQSGTPPEEFIYYDWELQDDAIRHAYLNNGGMGPNASESGLAGMGSESGRNGNLGGVTSGFDVNGVHGGTGDMPSYNISSSVPHFNGSLSGSVSVSMGTSTGMESRVGSGGALRRDPMSPSRDAVAVAVESGERPGGIMIPGRLSGGWDRNGSNGVYASQQPYMPPQPMYNNGTSSSFGTTVVGGVGSLGSGVSNFMFGSPPTASSSAFRTLDAMGRADSRGRSGMYAYGQHNTNYSQGNVSGNNNMSVGMTGNMNGDTMMMMREDYEEDVAAMEGAGLGVGTVPIIPGGYEDQDVVDCVADGDSMELKSPPPLPHRANSNRMDGGGSPHPTYMPM